ncbi:MAG: amidase family protein [Thermoleophilia bacterium]
MNAVVRWCQAAGAGDGPLAGVRVGLKDNIAVAGVPLTCGSRLPGDHVPARDAVVVERLLAAGAAIVAKLNLEDLALSGGGETSAFGPVLNPHDRGRTASGSSGGSAAALAYDGVDLTLGTDQGGSIRLPASWCGVVGLKPSYGLVPYTGIAGLDPALDHVGPLAASVELVARGLEAIAGPHPSDPRQPCDLPGGGYVAAVERAADDLRGVRLGVVVEGAPRERPDGEDASISDAYAEALERLRGAGAELVAVALPEHREGAALMFAQLVEGIGAALDGIDTGTAAAGWLDEGLAEAVGRGRRRPATLPPTAVALLLLARHARSLAGGALAARARNRGPALREAYDRALAGVDALVLPTSTQLPHRLAPDAPLADHVLRGWGMTANTAPTDVTGHPAVSLPLAEAAGLPVGVMLVGRRLEDCRLLGLARTVERAVGWRPPLPRIAGAGAGAGAGA